MTRSMGDAIADNVPKLHALSLDLYAGYVTGTTTGPGIRWSAADWSLFPAAKRVTIDQGGPGAPDYAACVMDIETGAWSPNQATTWCNHCTHPRPTIYVNRSNLYTALAAARLSTRFKGDIWISYPGWTPDNLHGVLPALPEGCQYVAVQNQLDVAGAYDLSTVLDPSWPSEEPMSFGPHKAGNPVLYTVLQPGGTPVEVQAKTGWRYCELCGAMYWPGKEACPGNPQ